MATVRGLLAEAASALRAAGIDSPHLDASLLLSDVLGISREGLYARLTDSVTSASAARFGRLIDERKGGVPVAYLRGVKEFYGRDFLVDSRVLIPRPDTEVLVDGALELLRAANLESSPRLHDCCTGSGCVAITLKAELPEMDVTASDRSEAALEVARENCRRLLGPSLGGQAVRFFHSDLLSALREKQHIITANPPYVAENEVREILASGSPEPPAALVGGETGSETPRLLVRRALDHLVTNGYLLVEVGFGQASVVMEEMESTGYRDLGTFQDLQGMDRVVHGRKE